MKKHAQNIQLSKIEHRGKARIKVLFPKREELLIKIKSIEGRRWSRSKNCWHVPYNKSSFQAIEVAFGKDNLLFQNKKRISDSQRKIPLSKREKGKIQPLIKDYPCYGEIRKRFVGDKILVQGLNDKWIKVYVPHDKKGWLEVIRNINGRRWDVDNAYWILPYVKVSFYAMKKNIGLEYVILDLEVEKDIPDKFDLPFIKSKSKKNKNSKSWDLLNDYQKKAIQDTEEYLILKQYSPTTIKSYRTHLIAILLFHNKILPEKIENKEIQSYLLHQIKFKRISESTQNVVINAYKAYVEKILDRPRTYVVVPRPKKPKKLPDILSTEEVISLINVTKNLKHKICLLLIYSAGLRRSELLNLLNRSINTERRKIHIKGGKGKKDRYVTLAETVIPYLKEYRKIYKPLRWLIEGKYGEKYSGSSLQKIFKEALIKSKVNPYATLHTLRHSYATHCVENGHNLKSVQEALGHNSLKTTEIYLHISSKALNKLRSPLDNLTLD